MNIQDIYESFFDTYRNVGYIISELSQRTLRRASAVAGEAAKAESKPSKNDRDETAKKVNREKLARQSDRFFSAAEKKARDSEADTGVLQTGEARDKAFSRFKRASIVNKDLRDTEGFTSDKEFKRAVKKGTKDANNVKRLRKRYKGELDG